jgi:ADP-ribosylglycohydrolase
MAEEKTMISDRCNRARHCLQGLSLGDAFGQQFFAEADQINHWLRHRELPPAPWEFTDDSIMALAVVETLERCGLIEQDVLARAFAAKYRLQPNRGYGGTTRGLLERVSLGEDWRVLAPQLFSGMGSAGNGAAMRSAPIGAYFAGQLDQVIDQAILSAEITHSHADAQWGAVAVALAAALIRREYVGAELLGAIISYLPKSAIRDRIELAAQLLHLDDPRSAAGYLGNGTQLLAIDTVPFALWCVALGAVDYEETLWRTVSALGDRDTTCAIVGGIVVGAVSEYQLPTEWLARREELTAFQSIGVEDIQRP